MVISSLAVGAQVLLSSPHARASLCRWGNTPRAGGYLPLALSRKQGRAKMKTPAQGPRQPREGRLCCPLPPQEPPLRPGDGPKCASSRYPGLGTRAGASSATHGFGFLTLAPPVSRDLPDTAETSCGR